MSGTKLIDLAKQTIENCSDIHCFNPETNEDTGIGMALSETVKIIHQYDDGKLYLLEEKEASMVDLFEVTEEILEAFEGLMSCINELKEMEV